MMGEKKRLHSKEINFSWHLHSLQEEDQKVPACQDLSSWGLTSACSIPTDLGNPQQSPGKAATSLSSAPTISTKTSHHLQPVLKSTREAAKATLALSYEALQGSGQLQIRKSDICTWHITVPTQAALVAQARHAAAQEKAQFASQFPTGNNPVMAFHKFPSPTALGKILIHHSIRARSLKYQGVI